MTEQTRAEIQLYVDDAIRTLQGTGKWQLVEKTFMQPSYLRAIERGIVEAVPEAYPPVTFEGVTRKAEARVKRDTVKGRTRLTVTVKTVKAPQEEQPQDADECTDCGDPVEFGATMCIPCAESYTGCALEAA